MTYKIKNKKVKSQQYEDYILYGDKELDKEILHEHWGNGKAIKFKGKSYQVGKMSYGQYFLTPFEKRNAINERMGFVNGTIFLEKTDQGKFIQEE